MNNNIPLSPIHNIICNQNSLSVLPVPPAPKKGYKQYYIHEKKEWIHVKNTELKSAH
jgi:hypothetical protein